MKPRKINKQFVSGLFDHKVKWRREFDTPEFYGLDIDSEYPNELDFEHD